MKTLGETRNSKGYYAQRVKFSKEGMDMQESQKKKAACRLQETMVTPKMKLQTRLPLMKVASLPQGNRVAQIAHCPPTLPSLSV